MRKLYYNIKITRKNSRSIVERLGYEASISNGFLKVELDNHGIKNIEGVLNLDYVCSEVKEDKIILRYYIPTEDFKALRKDFEITFGQDEIELPISYENATNVWSVQIRTLSKVIDEDVKKYYDARLEEFKKNIVFS